MNTLSEEEFIKTALPCLRKIFKSDDPYGEPFADNVEKRLILHEYYYNMDSPLLEAIVEAALNQGETGFNISITEGYNYYPKHWYLPFTEISKYPSFIGGLMNAVFSPNGNWGIMSTDEDFAILGGDSIFIDEIKKYIPTLDKQVNGFLKTWLYNKNHYNSDISWLPKFLSNVYNPETAEEMLLKYHLV